MLSSNSSLLSFNDALSLLLSESTPLTKTEKEFVSLDIAENRITGKSVMSPYAVPSFNNSAMDGYAIRFTDLQHNLTLPISGKIFAGKNWTNKWLPHSCIRVMTGAMVPPETDAVVMQENTTITEQGVTFNALPQKGENIRLMGEDISQGAEIIPSGTRLTSTLLATLASLGFSDICVYHQLNVAIFSTGNELQTRGNNLKLGQIYDTNRFYLNILLQRLGCRVIDLGIIPDDKQAITKAFLQADEQADLILSSGGVSVGEADFTGQILSTLGNIHFWKLAIKPGKPFAFGHLRRALFCGLPGNPVSALVTFYQLVQPLIRKLSADKDYDKKVQFTAHCTTPLKKKAGRMDFQRGKLTTNDQGEWQVASVGAQGSHLLYNLSQANCFIVLEQERGNVEAGEWVTVEPFNALLG